MSTKKLWVLGFILGLAVLISGCKKSSDDTTSPTPTASGKIVINDSTIALSKCYSRAAPAHLQEYLLIFVPSNIVITGMTSTGFASGSSGAGTMVLLIVKVPENMTGVVVGDYSRESESRVPFNFDGAVEMTADISNPPSNWGELKLTGAPVLHVTQSNGMWSFSSSGTTEGGKQFTFSYTGSITKL